MLTSFSQDKGFRLRSYLGFLIGPTCYVLYYENLGYWFHVLFCLEIYYSCSYVSAKSWIRICRKFKTPIMHDNDSLWCDMDFMSPCYMLCALMSSCYVFLMICYMLCALMPSCYVFSTICYMLCAFYVIMLCLCKAYVWWKV